MYISLLSEVPSVNLIERKSERLQVKSCVRARAALNQIVPLLKLQRCYSRVTLLRRSVSLSLSSSFSGYIHAQARFRVQKPYRHRGQKENTLANKTRVYSSPKREREA